MDDPQSKHITNVVLQKTLNKKEGEPQMKNENGITLITLIIAMIIMLILLRVTMSASIYGGLFEKTKKTDLEFEKTKKTDLEKEVEREQNLVSGEITLDGETYGRPKKP